ncbi:DNA repair protein RadC [Candidatus Woesearchaeota archaeon]|nr:DNA repair protein RadC [Candidatus Woesearchaeota archaeon]
MQQYVLKIRDFPTEERPRERLMEKGPAVLSNSELMAIILGKGTRQMNVLEMSKGILSRYDLRRLSEENVSSLCSIHGLGSAKACQIVACFELGRRLTSSSSEPKAMISCAEDVFRLLHPGMRLKKREHLIGLFLNTRKRVMKQEILSIGTLDASTIHPREILKPAIKESAAAIIIAHNHPSGDPGPSREDIDITKQIIRASKLIGIPLLDHIIIGDNCYVSLRESSDLRSLFS